MKSGRNLQEWAAEIDRQSKTKRDFVGDTSTMRMVAEDSSVRFRLNGQDSFGITDIGHDQLAGRINIPRKYYDRMLAKQPELLSRNVNAWLEAEPQRVMVRTLDGRARAFLSERYRRLDNFDLARAILPEIAGKGDLQIQSCELTERRLYLKVTNPSLRREVKVGDIVEAGVSISNSEIGGGALEVAPLVLRLVCLNGAKVNDLASRRIHVGRSNGESEAVQELLSDEALQADDRAFYLKVRDLVRASINDVAGFEKIVARFSESVGIRIAKPIETVELTAKKFGLVEGERESVLQHLVDGGDLSLWGLVNAVTRASQDVASYDRASELEELGGSLAFVTGEEARSLALAA